MDTCALGFKSAYKMIENGKIKNFVEHRYRSWGNSFGKKLLNQEFNLEEISKLVEENEINPQPRSGKQEHLENLVNNSLIKI